MTKQKSFKKTGAEAVSKFFSQETINALDTPVTQSVHDTQNTHNVILASEVLLEKDTTNIKNDRVQKHPRINMAFEEELLAYMHVMVRLDNTGSVTKYVNQLIRHDKNIRKEEYKKAMELFSNK